ncbi:MAG TPA: hypothetical protein VN842_05230 [Thermoplasmata archaeon]|nr:hypothetical protein [Thermoplasmata archaeon]
MGPSPVGQPPEEFDPFVAWLGEVSDRLVLEGELPLEEVRSAVEATFQRVERHLHTTDPPAPDPASPPRCRELADILRSDHLWFESSLEELEGLLRVVE